MAEPAPLDRVIAEVCAAAETSGTLIIETALALEGSNVPVARIEEQAFPALVSAVKPRIVYVLASPFEAAEDVLAALETPDDSLLTRPRFKKLVTKWQHRDGQTARIALGLMCDGVLHGIVKEAEWLADFEAEVETLADDVSRAAAEHQRLASHVAHLIADPRFSAPKVGAAKRTALAAVLFPDLDRQTLHAIVERAENSHWLATAGR